MPLLKLESASLHYGTQVLLDEVDLSIDKGEKLGLLGRNGVGKTSLLTLLSGELKLDSGERWLRPGTRLARLQQTLPAADERRVFDVVAAGLEEVGAILARYHQLALAEAPDMGELADVQHQLEAVDGWRLNQRVETVLSRFDLPADATMSSLSGGWRRRVALAQALVCEPDILLLDEPTNHLDIPAITWLEEQLVGFQGALVLITHDRRFLQKVVTSIAELDRGHLSLWRGDYKGFLAHRDQQLEAESRANAEFDKKLAEEERWIRQGIKARRTRNEGRVRALEAMREKFQSRRSRQGTAAFSLEDSTASGKLVAELRGVSHAYGERVIVDNFSTIVQRGDRIGIVGPNGAGKSTLVNLLLGNLQPDSGIVRLGTKLDIAYSDQQRSQLELDKNLIDNVCGGQSFIEIGGRKRHAISYLGDFLFTPERVRTPVKALSGGEQNRAVLARLFCKPSNLLVLDEPTNDLDIETLELLEEILMAFDGTVLLVSHDREFMDNVVTSLLVLEGDGRISEHAGGFGDYEQRGGHLPILAENNTPATPPQLKPPSGRPQSRSDTRKHSYKEKRELESLPGQIDALEQRQQELATQVSSADFHLRDHAEVQRVSTDLANIQLELDSAVQRWVELEDES